MNLAPPEPHDTPHGDSVKPASDPAHGTVEGTEAHGGAHGGAASGGGLPQLKPESFAGQLFWLAVTFVLLYVLMSSVALPRIAKVLEARKTRIRDDLDAAARAQADAQAAGKAHEQSLTDARARARKLSDEARAKAQAESDARARSEGEQLAAGIAKAEQRIQAMRTAALANVEGIAAEAAGSIVERLAGVKPSAAAVASAVNAALKRG
jgi:F-type H+-transporting ATPase subunit b